jgi:hypothetical protein
LPFLLQAICSAKQENRPKKDFRLFNWEKTLLLLIALVVVEDGLVVAAVLNDLSVLLALLAENQTYLSMFSNQVYLLAPAALI